MTESDKAWMTSEFNRVHDSLKNFKDQCDIKVSGLDERLTKVEDRTSSNSTFIWMVTGGLILLSIAIGIFELSIKI
jgi:hypothetical protein